MEIGFRNNDVRKICEDEQYARKNFPEKIVSNLKKLMFKLNSVQSFGEFRQNPANVKYNTHELHGKSKGLIALYLDHSYRMTVKVLIKENQITIWEISNHYGD